MKIYLSKINEDWIVDRVRKDWYENNKSISTKFIKNSNIAWIISPWLWKKIPEKYLIEKKILCSIYHIDLTTFKGDAEKTFYELEEYVDEFHVISEKTKKILSELTNKKITSIPLWVNQRDWFYIEDKVTIRREFNFTPEEYLVGSFQRDTEGHDLISPKLIKGPDLFIEAVLKLYEKNKNLKVVLTGKRRQYIIKRLQENKIPYKYFEMVKIEKLNKLYNILDLYIVSSRTEGGPQAIVECGITKTPVVSTNVGIAEEILSPESIYDIDEFYKAEPNVEYAFNKSKELTVPKGMKKYVEMFEDIYEN